MVETMEHVREHRDEVADGAEADEGLVAEHIVRDPHGYGPDTAQVVPWGPAVWVLIAYLRGDGTTVARTAAAYGIPEVGVRAALAYYRQNRALIDARLLLNDAAALE